MTVRAATAADVSWVADLESESFGVDAWSPSTVSDELLGQRRVAVVATAQGPGTAATEPPRGYAVALLGDRAADLLRVAVVAAYRRTGVGTELLEAVSARVATAGAERVLLEVSTGNRAAARFYARQGYDVIDRRPGYYRDGTDALVMQRLLHGCPGGAR